eukprot:3022754-Rhodomonas_salina.2
MAVVGHAGGEGRAVVEGELWPALLLRHPAQERRKEIRLVRTGDADATYAPFITHMQPTSSVYAACIPGSATKPLPSPQQTWLLERRREEQGIERRRWGRDLREVWKASISSQYARIAWMRRRGSRGARGARGARDVQGC